MRLNFLINEDYLILHTLTSIAPDRFSSSRHKKDIIVFQNYAWRKSRQSYEVLLGRFSVNDVVNRQFQNIYKALPKFLADLKQSTQYRKLLKQTKIYLRFCKMQWDRNYSISGEIISKLTGFKLNKIFNVYITHPSLRNGSHEAGNIITWGHHEDWPNYATVYLWHEILHSHFGKSDIEHAIIQLISDNELRIRLNGGKYPPFVGHRYLHTHMRKLLPYWKKYIAGSKMNILLFTKEFSKKFK